MCVRLKNDKTGEKSFANKHPTSRNTLSEKGQGWGKRSNIDVSPRVEESGIQN